MTSGPKAGRSEALFLILSQDCGPFFQHLWKQRKIPIPLLLRLRGCIPIMPPSLSNIAIAIPWSNPAPHLGVGHQGLCPAGHEARDRNGDDVPSLGALHSLTRHTQHHSDLLGHGHGDHTMAMWPRD